MLNKRKHSCIGTVAQLHTLKLPKAGDDVPHTSLSMICIYSAVSLNGARSKCMPPGELLSMKPKSMCTKWPCTAGQLHEGAWRACRSKGRSSQPYTLRFARAMAASIMSAALPHQSNWRCNATA